MTIAAKVAVTTSVLAAIVAAIALTLRRRPDTKYQNPAKQVRVSRNERVRLVKMASEKKG